jgi:type IV secretion system protein TrbL
MLALGIFGPGIATGLVSGAPQLGAGAAVGTIAGVTAGGMAGGAMARGAVGGAGHVATSSVGAAASMAGGARTAYTLASTASGATGPAGVAAGLGGVVSARRVFSRMAGQPADRAQAGGRAAFTATGGSGAGPIGPAANDSGAPDWARRIRASQATRDAGMAAASAVRDGDRPGSGESPRLKDEE